DPDAAGAQVVEVAADDPVPLAAARQLQGIAAHVGDGAALEGAVAYAVAAQCAGGVDSGLRSAGIGAREPPVGVGEREAAEGQVLHELPGFRMPLEAQELGKGGRYDLRVVE